MPQIIHADPVPLETDQDGVIRVKGTRLTIDTVIAAYRQGELPEAICENFAPLSLSDVHAVIAYYLRHQEEVDSYLERRRREAQELRQEIERRFPPDGIRDRLIARRQPQ